jgi:glutathione S-transferase
MRLFHHPFSSNARRAVMTAITLGVDVELVTVDLGRGEQRGPDFLKMNPNGRVPVLEHDGFLLTESHAIMLYLADITPGQSLLPAEVRGRADVTRWLFWSAYHLTPAVAVLNREYLVKGLLGLGGPDPAEVARGNLLVGEHARVLDAHLATRTWIAQDQLTLADLALAAALMTHRPANLPLDGHAAILAWLERVQALPAWKQTEPAPGR